MVFEKAETDKKDAMTLLNLNGAAVAHYTVLGNQKVDTRLLSRVAVRSHIVI